MDCVWGGHIFTPGNRVKGMKGILDNGRQISFSICIMDLLHALLNIIWDTELNSFSNGSDIDTNLCTFIPKTNGHC